VREIRCVDVSSDNHPLVKAVRFWLKRYDINNNARREFRSKETQTAFNISLSNWLWPQQELHDAKLADFQEILIFLRTKQNLVIH
jgi:hypothetical protein